MSMMTCWLEPMSLLRICFDSISFFLSKPGLLSTIYSFLTYAIYCYFLRLTKTELAFLFSLLVPANPFCLYKFSLNLDIFKFWILCLSRLKFFVLFIVLFVILSWYYKLDYIYYFKSDERRWWWFGKAFVIGAAGS